MYKLIITARGKLVNTCGVSHLFRAVINFADEHKKETVIC